MLSVFLLIFILKCHLFGPAIDWINGALSVEKLKHSNNDLLLERSVVCCYNFIVILL